MSGPDGHNFTYFLIPHMFIALKSCEVCEYCQETRRKKLIEWNGKNWDHRRRVLMFSSELVESGLLLESAKMLNLSYKSPPRSLSLLSSSIQATGLPTSHSACCTWCGHMHVTWLAMSSRMHMNSSSPHWMYCTVTVKVSHFALITYRWLKTPLYAFCTSEKQCQKMEGGKQ